MRNVLLTNPPGRNIIETGRYQLMAGSKTEVTSSGVYSHLQRYKTGGVTMLTKGPITCIKKNCQSRLSTGATRDKIIEYLDHLKNDVWKFNPHIVAEIERIEDEMKEWY
jgi:hypothetical protein